MIAELDARPIGIAKSTEGDPLHAVDGASPLTPESGGSHPGLLDRPNSIIFDKSHMTPHDLFGAFANPIRLRILNLLQTRKEICVCDLCEVLDVAQPKVSRHLAILREAQLVDDWQEGKWKFYSLAQPTTPLHRTLLRCVGSCLGEVEELAADRERLEGIEAQLRCR